MRYSRNYIYEDTKTVRNSIHQMLTFMFEEARMKELENETFNEFYAKLNDIVTLWFQSGRENP